MTQTTATPIQTTWKISEVLQRYPDLLETIISMSPAFSRLHNPVLRKVQSRLVTVEQAARIAGISPDEMARKLNTAAGLDVVAEVSDVFISPEPSSAEPDWVRTAKVTVDLDVRPLHERGEEPFAAIMEAVRAVAPGEILRLRNSFDPVPLYDVLRMRGFDHVTRQLSSDDWEILFLNSGNKSSKTAPNRQPVETGPAPAAPAAETWDADETITIDVSELVPPEPMMRILGALEEMPAGASLLVHHVRRPMFLYPQLDELGYTHETRDLGPGQVEIIIHKPARPEAAGA
jgi:uncharacterized protein (DUF2249 family)